MPSENVIRDKLSTTLDILEAGLTLVEVNHKLPNAVGSKGFIDILARDRLGIFVIIELKRSDQSSREALFEILKYLPLFIRHHGVKANRIRCFIVSTTWRELLVPYSEFRRQCPASQTEGFRIDVDEVGNVTKAEKVAEFGEEDPARPFRVHCSYLYPTAAERDAAVPLLRAAYEKAGATGHLLFRFDYRGSSPNVIFPFAAYFVTTRVDPGLLARLGSEAAAELADDEGGPSESELRHSVEDRFLGMVNESLGDHFSSCDLEVSVSTPDNFGYMVERNWGPPVVERVGPYASEKVLSDADVIEMVKGLSGDNTVRFERLTSPSTRLDWNDARRAAASFLRGNPIWQVGTGWFLDRIEQEFPDGTIFVQAYNPLMLPETLYKCATTQASDYVPQLAIAAISKDGPCHEALVGTLVWDGKMLPTSVQEVFEGLSEGINDVQDYYFAKVMGVAWETDEELVRRHGLQYSLCFLKYAGEDDKEATGLTVRDGRIEELSAPLTPDSFIDYFDAARSYLEELFARIDSSVMRLP